MRRKYKTSEIQDALDRMQGFVDISPKDVKELLSKLDQLRRRRQKVAPIQVSLRAAKYGFLKFRRYSRFSDRIVSRISMREILYSWVFSFMGIAALGVLGVLSHHYVFVIGSFGASAVLIYGAPRSPLSQPRNFVGGHVVSALIGVTVYLLLPNPIWLASALAVASAIVAMHLTKTLHPPGGATALIAIIGSANIHELGYWYVVSPVFLGALLLLVVAVVMNNVVSGRSYPDRWL
jgi:CBS-domain-containing membrane protein